MLTSKILSAHENPHSERLGGGGGCGGVVGGCGLGVGRGSAIASLVQ